MAEQVFRCDAAHAALLRTIERAFFRQRKERKSEVTLFRDATLDALRLFIVNLNASRDILDRQELALFCGEVVRMLALGSSARQCRMLAGDAKLRQLFVDTGLLSQTEWEDIAQRATGRLDEGLSYRDLMPAQEEMTQEKEVDDLPRQQTSHPAQGRRKRRPGSMHFLGSEPGDNCTVS